MPVPVAAMVVELVFYGLGMRLRNVTIGVIILVGAYYRAVDVLVGKYTNEIFPGQLRCVAVQINVNLHSHNNERITAEFPNSVKFTMNKTHPF
jgi:hypothetical protein